MIVSRMVQNGCLSRCVLESYFAVMYLCIVNSGLVTGS